MQTNFQEYEVTLKLRYTSEVFPGDPDDVYELADLERYAVVTELNLAFPDSEILSMSIDPVLGE